MFADNRVPQRGKANTIWSWTAPGQTECEEIGGQEASSVAGKDRAADDGRPASGENFRVGIGGVVEPCWPWPSIAVDELTHADNGDGVKPIDVDFSKRSAKKISAYVCSEGGGESIELRLGGTDGKLIGTCKV